MTISQRLLLGLGAGISTVTVLSTIAIHASIGVPVAAPATPKMAVLVDAGVASVGSLSIDVSKDACASGVKISPTLYGLMTEEINHSYEGGLYAELLQNRSFKDDPNTPVHWSIVQDDGGVGEIGLDTSDPVNTALDTSLKLSVTRASANQRVGVANDGYWGIPVKPHTTYSVSFFARAAQGFSGPLNVDIESADGSHVWASAQVSRIGTDWEKYTVTLKTAAAGPSSANRFVVSVNSPGTVWLSQVSLFPPTFNNRKNGTRIDLMNKMAAMSPSFLRMPGGNYLEGNEIDTRFNWKNSLGDISQRPGHMGPWGYRSSDGFGLLEFLEWCEDLHMKPVLAIYAGYSLRGAHVNPGPDLAPYVQDALDEIEYVTGDAHSKWGARRAADGHPAPFPLTYIEVGNEDFFDKSGSYDGRFAQFHDAIKQRYSDLKLIATASVKTRTPDVIDEHYYRSSAVMERDAHHYDTYDRKGPKIFVGEWASTDVVPWSPAGGRVAPTPDMNEALGDAAWMTGMERNSDVVVMNAYAPMLVNVNPGGRQWAPNLIGYDALSSYGSPSYYALCMFGNNKGDVVLPVSVKGAAASNPFVPAGAVGVGTWSTQAEFKDVSITNGAQSLYQSDLSAMDPGFKQNNGGAWQIQDGALAQTTTDNGCNITLGDPKWTDYTLDLKAKKTGGKEGFLILFHVKDNNNYLCWNIGGWGNTRTNLQRSVNGDSSEIGTSTPVTVDAGRWYDIRVELKGNDVKCFLDGKLVNETTDRGDAVADPVYAEASRDLSSGDVILKLVNTSNTAQPFDITLNGAGSVGQRAAVTQLSGGPDDINTISAPEKIKPVTVQIGNAGRDFSYTFPAFSISIIRLKVK